MPLGIAKHLYTLGCHTNDGLNVDYQDENTLIYVSGNVCVLYNTEFKSQKFIPASDRTLAISAICVSTNRRYLAVAERGLKAQIVIHDMVTMRRRKTLFCNDVVSPTFTHLAFTCDDKKLIAQSEVPDQLLICFLWEKGAVLSTTTHSTGGLNAVSYKGTIRHLATHPKEPNYFGVAGDDDLLKIFRMSSEDKIKLVYRIEGPLLGGAPIRMNWNCFLWVDHPPAERRIVAGTKDGRLFLYEGDAIKTELSLESNDNENEARWSKRRSTGSKGVNSSEDDTNNNHAESNQNARNLNKSASQGSRLTSRSVAIRIAEDENQDTNKGEEEEELDAQDAAEKHLINMATKNSANSSENLYYEQVHCLMQLPTGFACSYGKASVIIFDKVGDKDGFFQRSRKIRLPQEPWCTDPRRWEQQIIRKMAVPPSEELFVCATDTNQLYIAPLTTTNKNELGEEQMHLLDKKFHSASVNRVGICVRKPLLTTVSSDRSVRVWNIETGEMEIYKEFNEEAFGVAFHPSGLYMAVGFIDRLRLLNIMIDDIKVFYEFTIKSAKEIAFSHGGHLFAAADQTIIKVYHTTTFENAYNLKGHAGMVVCLRWNFDDSEIVSCGTRGAIYKWRVSEERRSGETVFKKVAWNSLGISPDARNIFAVGSDCTVREIMDHEVVKNVDLEGVELKQIVISNSGRLLFVGTRHGTIRSLKFPLAMPIEFVEYQAHSSPITSLVLSQDDQFLVSASADSTVIAWKITDKGYAVKEQECPYAEEILITKSDLEQRDQELKLLHTRLEDSVVERDYQLRMKDVAYGDQIKELTETFISEANHLLDKLEAIRYEKQREADESFQKLSETISKYAKEKEQMTDMYEEKLVKEYERVLELENLAQMDDESHERALAEVARQGEEKLDKSREFYEIKIEELSNKLDAAVDEAATQIKEFEETYRQIEEDCDQEILDLKWKYETILKRERDGNFRLKAESGLIRKKFTNVSKEIEDRNEDIRELKLENNRNLKGIKQLEKDIEEMEKEISERDDTIQDKEHRIYDLKSKTQELEKFKFVLDYKIKELRKQIEPKEREIKMKNKEIEDMEGELGQISLQNHLLSLNIKTMRQNVGVKDREVERCNAKLREKNTTLKRIKEDIYKTSGLTQDAKDLKNSVVGLHRKYCEDVVDMGGGKTSGDVLLAEFQRQRKHLEGTMAVMTRKLGKDSKMQKADNVRIMHQNVLLIKEVNDLRHDLKMARADTHDLEVLMGYNSKNRPPDIVSDALATSSNELAIVRSVVLKQQAEIRGLRDELFDQNMQMIDQLTKLAGVNAEQAKPDLNNNASSNHAAHIEEELSLLASTTNDIDSNANANNNNARKSGAKGKEWRKNLINRARAKPKSVEKTQRGDEIRQDSPEEVAVKSKRSFIKEFALPPI